MKRKTLSLVLGLVLLQVPAAGAEESLEAVLASYYDAIGGVEAWSAVTSCRMSGQMQMPQGMEGTFTMTYKPPLRSRLEFELQGMTMIQAFDGETGWTVVPFMGSTEPQVMPEEHSRMMREQADLAGPLIDWGAKGNEVELLGREETEEGEAYRLEVTLESGEVRYFLLDAESYLPVRIEATTEFMGNPVEVATTLSDFREVGGLMMAHQIETGPKGYPEGQKMVIEAIELDVDIADDFFSLPEPETEAEEGGAVEQE